MWSTSPHGRYVEDQLPPPMDIEPVIAALGTRFHPAEAAEIDRFLRAYSGTIPDDQLISEASLALAIHRRGRVDGGQGRP